MLQSGDRFDTWLAVKIDLRMDFCNLTLADSSSLIGEEMRGNKDMYWKTLGIKIRVWLFLLVFSFLIISNFIILSSYYCLEVPFHLMPLLCNREHRIFGFYYLTLGGLLLVIIDWYLLPQNSSLFPPFPCLSMFYVVLIYIYSCMVISVYSSQAPSLHTFNPQALSLYLRQSYPSKTMLNKTTFALRGIHIFIQFFRTSEAIFADACSNRWFWNFSSNVWWINRFKGI